MGIENLKEVIKKEEILKTQAAEAFIEDPKDVEDYYKLHISTHVDIGGIEEYKKRFFSRLENQSPLVGAVVARYGFGKTSTLVRWWYECEQKHYFAVPPFNFDYLQDIARATYGWLKYRLNSLGREDLCNNLESSYEEIAKKISRHVEEKYNLTEEQIAEMMDDGVLRPELTAHDLKKFLEICVNLSFECGYKGLAIFADEFQRVTLTDERRDVKRSLQKFREFIDGIKTLGQIPLSFVVAIPQELVPLLEERRRDIVERLKADQMYVDFQNVFDRDFPSLLWDKMSKELHFSGERYRVISSDSLESLGQIISLPIFHAGPRTVIRAFKLASDLFMKSETCYEIERLVDDLIDGTNQYISTDYSSVVKRALELSEIDNFEKERVLKILAAYPEGVREDYFENLGLGEIFTDMHKRFMGEYIRWTTFGYSLPFKSEKVSLDDELLKEFWRLYDPCDSDTDEIAMEVFAKEVIPLLFSEQRGQLKGWAGARQFSRNSDSAGGYVGILNGSFSELYPKRQISVKLIDRKEQIFDSTSIEDFQMIFLLGEESAFLMEDHAIIIGLEKSKSYSEEGIPSSLKPLSKRFLPKQITPKLLLNLASHIEKSGIESSALDYKRRDYIQNAILMFFNEDLRSEVRKIGVDARSLGRSLLEEIFSGICRIYWPDYVTIMNSLHWQKAYILEYKEMLRKLDIPTRRHEAVLSDTRDEIIGSYFGFKQGTYSSFPSRMKEYEKMGLLHLEEGDKAKDSISVIILEHPFERKIKEMLKEGKSLSLDEIREIGRSLGYREDELFELVDLLQIRGIAACINDDKIILQEPITGKEVENEINHLENYTESLKPHIPDSIYDEIIEDIKRARENSNEAISSEILEALHYESLPLIRKTISISVKSEIISKIEEARRKESELKAISKRLIPQILEERAPGTVGFVQHLEDCRIQLTEKYQSLSPEGILRETDGFLKEAENPEIERIERITQLFGHYQELIEQYQEFEKEKADIDQTCRLYERWRKSVLRPIETLRSRVYGTSIQEDVDSLIDEIQIHFAEKKLKGLSSVEQYESRIDELGKRKDEIEQERRGFWDRKKADYESYLSKRGLEDLIEDRIIRYGFDSQHEKASFDALIEACATKVSTALERLCKKIEGLQNDTRYFEIKNREKLTGINKEISAINERLRLLCINEEEFENDKSMNSFKNLIEGMINVNALIREIKQNIDEKKTPEEPSEEEKEILTHIAEIGANIDFIEILSKIGEIKRIEDPSDLFEEGSSMLMKLYEKGLIRISVSRRR